MPHEEAGEAGSEGGGGGVVPGTRRVKLRDVNAHLACVLCGGYLVDATTIVECLHSFCRSCIIKYLETNNFCPICDVQIHKAKPFLNIKPDKTLQDIVYKLVPGLFQAEMRRRREFYSQHPEQIALTTPEERGVGVERIIYSPEDSISLSLEYYDSCRPSHGTEEGESTGPGGAARDLAPGPPSAPMVPAPDPHEQKPQTNGDATNGSSHPPQGPPPSVPPVRNIPHKRYLQCPAVVTIGHLKKFLRLKFDLSAAYRVDVIHRGVCLPEDYTLMDVAYIYTWKRSEPMEFMYRIHEPPRPTVRRKRRQAPEAHAKEIAAIPGKANGEATSEIVTNKKPNDTQDSADDPPPPKLERIAEGPFAKEGSTSEVDQETLPPPTIDRPEQESACEEEKKPENEEKKQEAAEAAPKEEQSIEKPAHVKENADSQEDKMAAAEIPNSAKGASQDARVAAEDAIRSDPTPKKAAEAAHAVHTPLARPHSTPGAAVATPPAAARPHHPQQQQLPSPRPASSPPALVAQQTQGSAGDGRKDSSDQTPALPKEAAASETTSSSKADELPPQTTTSHSERKRPRESSEGDEASAAKRDRNGALDLSGGSSRLSGDSPPPASPSSPTPSPSSSPTASHPPSSSTPLKGDAQNAAAALIVPSGRITPATTPACSKSPALPKSAANSPAPSESTAPSTQNNTSASTNPTPSNISSTATDSKTANISAQTITSNATTTATTSNDAIDTNVSISSNNSSTLSSSKMTLTTTTTSSSMNSATPSSTTTTTTTTIASSADTPRVLGSTANGAVLQTSAISPGVTSRQGKNTKGQSTQTLQSIAQNLARNAQQKQLQQQQQQQQQKTLQKFQLSPQQPQHQKPLQHVPPLQTPKYSPQSKLQQQLQQQQTHHHQLMQQHQLQQHIQQQNQQHAHLLRQQHLHQQLQQNQQQNLRNHQPSKQATSQSKFPNTSLASTTASPPVTITISTKTSPARQSSPLNRANPSPINAVSPQNKSSGLTLSLGQINHHNSSANNRPSPKRGTSQVSNSNNFLQNNSLHHHHLLPHISISQHGNNVSSTSPATATSPGYPDPLSPLSSMSPFPMRTGNLRSPPPPLAPPPPPPPPSHHNSHPGAALRIPVPPSGKPRPSSLSSSSPSPSPPGDQHSSTPSPNGHASLSHQKASPNGSPGLAGRHDHFTTHHLHAGAMFSPHGLRFRQQMEMQSRHLAEQHLQQVAHQQPSAASPTVAAAAAAAAAANPQILQQWHQLHQLHLRHQQQQQQTANASQSAAAMTTGGYPMDWYSYPSSVKLLEYFMKLGHLPMFPFNNNTTSANNNSAGSAGTRK